MPRKQGSQGKTTYILTAKDRYKHLWVSRGDHLGIEWWAKQRKIAIAEAFYQIIHEFVGPGLAAFRQKNDRNNRKQLITL